MKLHILFFVVVVISINEVFSKCRKGDEDICSRVRCAPQTSCAKGYVLVYYDPKNCICCDSCVPINQASYYPRSDLTVPSECGPDRDPSFCDLVDCYYVTKCNKNERLVRRNRSKCICCDKCVPRHAG